MNIIVENMCCIALKKKKEHDTQLFFFKFMCLMNFLIDICTMGDII